MDYKVNLEKFSGPLDVLFSLIEEKKLIINEVSLSEVTDQFLEYLKKLETNAEGSLEYQRILANFLVIASRLILIKSRSLLPNLVLSEEEETDIKDLEERLKTYQQIKILGRELGRWANSRAAYFSREYFLDFPIIYGEQSRTTFYPPKNVSPENLVTVYENFLKTLPQIEKLEEQNLKRIITLEEKIKELSGRIGEAVEASFADVSSGVKSKIEVILTFLALLMLFRNRVLEVSQDKIFGEIKIKASQLK